MTPATLFLIIAITVIAIGILLILYLNGNFTYDDEIYLKQKYELTKFNPFTGHEFPAGNVERITIKRRYHSGRIKFITKEIKI